MLLVIVVILLVVGLATLCYGYIECEDTPIKIGFILLILWAILACYGTWHGFINYPASDGVHQGTLTAVDKEGVIFHRYRVYLKSSAFTVQGDETEYCLYLDETELAAQLKKSVGKQVKLYYGHPGGYIGVKSCGTYHITKVELIEE